MKANVSISVTPGSETLWSVHSGQRCWTRRFASSTRSWKRRSSRFGAGSGMSGLVVGERGAGREGGRPLLRDQVEGEDEVARVVRQARRVADVDQERRRVVGVRRDDDVLDVDARLPALERGTHL